MKEILIITLIFCLGFVACKRILSTKKMEEKTGVEVEEHDIITAVQTNNIAMLKSLLDSKKVKIDDYNFLLRQAAIFNNNAEILKLLLNSNEEIIIPCDLLKEAVYEKREIMEPLLDRWISQNNIIDNREETEQNAFYGNHCAMELLNSAIEIGNKDVIDLLVERGVKTDNLQTAIALGKKDEVEQYLKQGKDKNTNTSASDIIEMKPNSVSKTVETSNLYLAVINNQLEIAKLLLKYGSSANDGKKVVTRASGPILAGGNTEFTPSLTIAVSKGYGEMVKLLLENGADVNYEDINGNTVLDYVTGEVEKQLHKKYGTNIEYPKDEEIKQLLLKYGAKEGRHVSRIRPIY